MFAREMDADAPLAKIIDLPLFLFRVFRHSCYAAVTKCPLINRSKLQNLCVSIAKTSKMGNYTKQKYAK